MTAHGEPMAWLVRQVDTTSDACVRWPYATSKSGYARIWHNKRMYPAYRLVCEIAHGAPPDQALQAAHSCGNGAQGCVNPKHLRWATRVENEADKIVHNTVMRGTRNPRAKLSEFDVATIREIAPFATHTTLSRHYGVSSAQISRIVSGKGWKV